MVYAIGITPIPALIPAGQSLSGPIALGAFTLVSVAMPATWTAAGLTFQVSSDGGATWQELVTDVGAAVALTAAANTFIVLASFPPAVWRGINLIKVRSGTAGAPVVQVADALIQLITRNETI